jgi:Predicted Zn peptidase
MSLQETVCRSRACDVLKQFMVGSPDEIDLPTIAWSTGRLTIDTGKLDTAEGRLVASPSGGCIRISDAVQNEGRRRFIVGHELGHFCLHKAMSALDTAAELSDWRSGSRETEANIFSGELPDA